MRERTTPVLESRPAIAVRREQGYADGRHGRQATSSDVHYVNGYSLGERLRPTLPHGGEALPSQDARRSLTLEEEIQVEEDSLAMAKLVVCREAGIPLDTREAGAAVVAVKHRMARIRKLVLEGDIETLRAITAPTPREAEMVRLLRPRG